MESLSFEEQNIIKDITNLFILKRYKKIEERKMN